MKTIVVDNKFNNKKLSDFLYYNFSGLTKNTFYKTLRKKDIRVNDVKVNDDIIVHTNDIIVLYILDNLLYKNIKIETIYEDDNILIVNKPNNIEVVGSNSLTSLFEKKYDFVSPCHRLDRNTTGLILYAKNEDALNILLDKFKNREIEKHYLAKVYGIPNFCEKANFHTFTAYLFKDNKKSIVYISDIPKKGYIQIKTSIKLIDKNHKKNYSILEVELHTGKTHQIRAHLAHLGFPIIGDGKYGINQVNKKFNCKTQQLQSYILKFNFKTDAKSLNYLNGKEIILNSKFSNL